MSTKQQLDAALAGNKYLLEVAETQDLVDAWERQTGQTLSQQPLAAVQPLVGHVSPVLGLATVVRLAGDLGLTGRVETRTVNGKQYVILSGRPGNRSFFTGTRYLATNPKVVDMAIGKVGLNQSIVSGVRITVLLAAPLNVLRYLFEDNYSLARLFGTTAADIAKLGVAAAVAALAGAAVGTLTTIAVGPLVAAIGVGVLVGFALDRLDARLGVTEALVVAIEDTYSEATTRLGRTMHRLERALIYRVTGPAGLPAWRY